MSPDPSLWKVRYPFSNRCYPATTIEVLRNTNFGLGFGGVLGPYVPDVCLPVACDCMDGTGVIAPRNMIDTRKLHLSEYGIAHSQPWCNDRQLKAAVFLFLV